MTHRLGRLTEERAAQRSQHREPGRQPRVRRDRRVGAFQQVQVLTAANRVAPQQQVGREGQQPLRNAGQQRRVNRAEVQRRRRRRIMKQVGRHPLLQQAQCPVGLPGREEIAGRSARVARGLQPLGYPELQRELPPAVHGTQLRAQHLAHQMVIPVTRPVIIERHDEQVGRLDAAQQRRRVLPAGHRCAGIGGQLVQDRGLQHETRHLRWLLLEDFTDEVLGDRMTADIQRTRNLGRLLGGPQRQRGHLQRRDPPLTSSVQERELTGGDPHTEVLEQGAALGQREIQVAVTKLA